MFDELERPVGPDMPNQKEDVKLVQTWLSRWTRNPWISSLGENAFDAQTRSALEDFQRRVMRQSMPSGVVRPRDTTAKWLSNPPGAYPEGRALCLPRRSDLKPLSVEDYQNAAELLGCEARAIRAVAWVESWESGFDRQGRPQILFERRHFNTNTFHLFERSHPELTMQSPKAYGPASLQWTRLEAAYKLSSRAALLSTSWGKFQIMGENYRVCGFPLLELFVSAMCTSEKNHLNAFVNFVRFDGRKLDGIRTKNWSQFAKAYNGKEYKTYNYDIQLKAAYDKYEG